MTSKQVALPQELAPTKRTKAVAEEPPFEGLKYSQHLDIILRDGQQSHARIMELLVHFKDPQKQQSIKADFHDRINRLTQKTNDARTMVQSTCMYVELHKNRSRDLKQRS